MEGQQEDRVLRGSGLGSRRGYCLEKAMAPADTEEAALLPQGCWA